MRKRGDGRKWFIARRVISILVELAACPLTPEQIRSKTCMTQSHYLNTILRKLTAEGLVKCLNPQDRIGKTYSIHPAGRRRVRRLFRKAGIAQKIIPVPEINWNAYGKLSCGYCRQFWIVFEKMNELAEENRMITAPRLRERLPGMSISDIYRASKKLVSFGLIARVSSDPVHFRITHEGKAILAFRKKLHEHRLPNGFKNDAVATPEWKEHIALLKVNTK
jgi:DNA-binding PadR family transcriptional regulator